MEASLPVSTPMERGCREGETFHPHGAHVRNVCSRLGTQPTMVDSDDDRPLLIHPVQDAVHPPDPELFVLSDDGQPTAPVPPTSRVLLVQRIPHRRHRQEWHRGLSTRAHHQCSWAKHAQ